MSIFSVLDPIAAMTVESSTIAGSGKFTVISGIEHISTYFRKRRNESASENSNSIPKDIVPTKMETEVVSSSSCTTSHHTSSSPIASSTSDSSTDTEESRSPISGSSSIASSSSSRSTLRDERELKTRSIETLDEFFLEVKDMDHEQVVAYVRDHDLSFISLGIAIKIKKMKPLFGPQELVRSNTLHESLVIIRKDKNATLFPTKKTDNSNESPEGRSCPKGCGKNAGLLGVGKPRDGKPPKWVYRVLDLVTNTEVAISLVRYSPNHYKHSNFLLKKEHEITQNIHSPHILPVQGYGMRASRGGWYKEYGVSELCYGSAEDLYKHQPALWKCQLEGIESQLRSAIQAIHRAGYIHHDILAKNLLVKIDEKGRIHLFVADFEGAEKLTKEERKVPIPGPKATPRNLTRAQSKVFGVDYDWVTDREFNKDMSQYSYSHLISS